MRNDKSEQTQQLGKKMAKMRGKASQQEFAEKLGISRGYLSDLERGARNISVEMLVSVCHKTGTSPNKLLGF